MAPLLRALPLCLLLAANVTCAAEPMIVPPSAAKADSIRRAVGKELLSHRMTVADSMLRVRGGSHAERAQLLLSWDAPYGLPRARALRTPACANPNAGDTLYLSFIPGRESDTFSGFTAKLLIHAMPGDTLGPFWEFEKAGANGGGLIAEYDGVENFPGVRPYRAQGMGFVRLERTASLATLKMVYAVAQSDVSHIAADSIYALGRVVFRHAKTNVGCAQPVCIEWRSGTIGYQLKDEPEISRGERFVGLAPKGTDPIAAFRTTGPAPRVWKPKAGAPAGTPASKTY